MATGHNTCSVDNCGRVVKTFGMCAPHYHRNWLTGSPYRPCSECSKDIPVGTHGMVKLCEDCRVCKVKGCERQYYGQGLCQPHHSRKRLTGTLIRPCKKCGEDLPIGRDAGVKYCSGCSYSNGSAGCGVDGCVEPQSAQGLCSIHYHRMKFKGIPNRTCKGCGAEVSGGRGLRYCSESCKPRCTVSECVDVVVGTGLCDRHYKDASANGGVLPSLDFTCMVCGNHIKRSRGKKSQIARKVRCDSCRGRPLRNINSYRRRVLVGEIPAECGICGGSIDIGTPWPSPGSLTIDHIVPASLGGGNDDRNLRPAHNLCNIKRGNKLAPTGPGVLTLF